MAKTKAQKEADLAVIAERIETMKSAVIVEYKGLKVKDTEELRNNLRKHNVDFHVSKATLMKKALKNQGIEVDETVFDKPFAVAFAKEDEAAGAKEIDAFAKKNEVIQVLGGILEGRFIDAAAVKRLAGLPSREQLLGQLVGTIAAPMSGMVNVLAGNIRGLVTVLNARKDKIS